MEFDTKIKVILVEGLETWQAINVTAFLMSGIGGTQNIIGENYEDADGVQYLPMSRQPVTVLQATTDKLKVVLEKATERQMTVAIYTREIFCTYNDVDNRAAIKAVKTKDLNLVGIAILGPKNQLDRITKGLPMHP